MERMKLTLGRERDNLVELRRRQVMQLRDEGFRQIEIAARLGITQARVSQIVTSIERTRTNKRRMLRLLPSQPSAASA